MMTMTITEITPTTIPMIRPMFDVVIDDGEISVGERDGIGTTDGIWVNCEGNGKTNEDEKSDESVKIAES
jgi:hypothetical protein